MLLVTSRLLACVLNSLVNVSLWRDIYKIRQIDKFDLDFNQQSSWTKCTKMWMFFDIKLKQ